jgi:glycosyltransferase involved in cell wall biosynthesis
VHICFLTNEFPKEGFPHGGIGSFVKTLGAALVKEGVEVSVVGLNYIPLNEFEKIEGISVYRLKKSSVKGFSWYLNSIAISKKIKEIHSQNSIDIIEASELGFAFIKKIEKIKYVIRMHGGHHFFAESENRGITKWKGFQEKKSFKKCDAFIAVSQYVKLHTEKYLSLDNKPVGYISNPIDTDFFRPIQENEVENRIVFAGTVCEKKGIRQLIQAFPFVKNEFPNATLEVYGRDWFFSDGSSYMQMLKDKEMPQLGVSRKDIHFKGAVSYLDIPIAYSKAEVCVFPSHMETQGLVAPEAMAMEKTVVFTKLGPGPEAIKDHETGLLCDPHDPKSIAEKIIWVFSNKKESETIGKKARAFVLQKYSLKSIVLQNVDFYKKIISNNSHN